MPKYDVLLAYPKPTDDSPTLLTPLSILYPGALFESKGKKVAYFDQRFDSQEMLDELILCSDEIGVSCFTGRQAGHAARILMRLVGCLIIRVTTINVERFLFGHTRTPRCSLRRSSF